MFFLTKYLSAYKKETILAPLFKLLEASFELIVPLIIIQIIDVGISEKKMLYVLHMGLYLLVLAAIGLSCSITAQYFAAKAATGFAAKMRHELFQHIESLSFSEMDQIGTSTMITRMTSDVNQVQSGVNMVLRLFLRSPFIVIGAMIMAFTINVRAAIIFVIVIPVLSILIFGIMLITIPMYRKVQSNLDHVLQITRENLTGARVIRAFEKEESEKNNFRAATKDLMKMQQFVGRFSALMNPVTYLCINIGLVALIWTGGIQVQVGNLTQGQVVALTNYMAQILVELIKLANLIITVTKAFACADRIHEIFRIQSSIEKKTVQEISDFSAPENWEVIFSHVGLNYKNAGEEALSNIDFKVKKGQTIGIIGGTGAGKTSLVHLIPRFYDATEGEILVEGKNVKDYEIEQLRNKIGIVMQKAVLFEGTVRENLAWGNENASDEEMWKALRIAQADEFLMKKGEGLAFHLEQGGRNLSGGQKQRMTIARAIVRNPRILILDDSASALDFATDFKLRQAIRTIEGNMTVFIVSQRTASIMQADNIIVLDDGIVAGYGSHQELLEHCPVYQEIYYSQFPDKKISQPLQKGRE